MKSQKNNAVKDCLFFVKILN